MEILANLWTLYLQFNRTQKFGQTLTHLLCDKIIYEITDVQSRGRAARGTQRENQKMFLRIKSSFTKISDCYCSVSCTAMKRNIPPLTM